MIYLATGDNGDAGDGLWKLCYHADSDQFTGARLTKPGDQIYTVGLGLGREGGDYFTEPKMLYFSGIIDGEYGFFRTADECKTITRINNDRQMFGRIHSIDGDKRIFGRFFLATGSSGLLYGEMEENFA